MTTTIYKQLATQEHLIEYIRESMEYSTLNTMGDIIKATDMFGSLDDVIADFLEVSGLNCKNIAKHVNDNSDFWNDPFKDDKYFCDMSSVWADNHTFIYHDDMYKTASYLADDINEAILEYGTEEKTFEDLIIAGQYIFFSGFGYAILDTLTSLNK